MGESELSRRHVFTLAAGGGLLAVLHGIAGPDLAYASSEPEWFHPFTTRRTITKAFGYLWNEYHGEYRQHNGVDFAWSGNTGAPIYAIADGSVTISQDSFGGYGQTVKINHGNHGGVKWESLYGHMQAGSREVAVGQTVKAGTLLGRLGSTGGSTGPHLHLEIHRAGSPQNPASRVQNAPLADPSALTRKEMDMLLLKNEANNTWYLISSLYSESTISHSKAVQWSGVVGDSIKFSGGTQIAAMVDHVDAARAQLVSEIVAALPSSS